MDRLGGTGYTDDKGNLANRNNMTSSTRPIPNSFSLHQQRHSSHDTQPSFPQLQQDLQHGNNIIINTNAINYNTHNHFNVVNPAYAFQPIYQYPQTSDYRPRVAHHDYNNESFGLADANVHYHTGHTHAYTTPETRPFTYSEPTYQVWEAPESSTMIPIPFKQPQQFDFHGPSVYGRDIGSHDWDSVNPHGLESLQPTNNVEEQSNPRYRRRTNQAPPSQIRNTVNGGVDASFQNEVVSSESIVSGMHYGNEKLPPPTPATGKVSSVGAMVPAHYTSEFQTYAPPAPPTRPGAPRMSLKRGKPSGSTNGGKRPQRRGPLSTSTRNKVEEMRDMSACWRCRKYKKPCNGPGICDSCLIPKFKIWPSAIGCRRENLESMVLFLLPVQLEEGLGMLSEFKASPRSWRQYQPDPIKPTNHESLEDGDIWAMAKRDLLATSYFGNDFIELADIAIRYQRSLPVPHKCLQAACQTLLATCNWYKCVVNVPGSPPPIKILEAGTSVRYNTRKAFTLLQHTCLSTKRTDWFPAVLSALLLTIGAVYYMDVILHMPANVRDFIWHDLNNTRADLRNKTYMLLVDLLRVSTKGINPLKLDCWARPVIGRPDKEDKIREREREVLLGGDQAAMIGLADLKAWQIKYGGVLEQGKQMFAADMVQQSRVPPIAGSWKVFEMG